MVLAAVESKLSCAASESYIISPPPHPRLSSFGTLIFNNLLSLGLSWAQTHRLHVKSSILIDLFCIEVILNTKPSVGIAVGSSVRLHADLL